MTGYTYELVEKNQSFNQFVWSCARAFGALVMMRDDPSGAKIKLIQEPSKYYIESLEEAKEKLEQLLKLKTKKEKTDYALNVKQERLKALHDSINNETRKKENKIIADMIVKVKSWNPPILEHKSLKDFMLDQLTSSLNNNEDKSYYYEQIETINNMSLIEIYEQDLKNTLESVQYRQQSYEEEVKRTKERTAWLTALNNSVPLPKELQCQ